MVPQKQLKICNLGLSMTVRFKPLSTSGVSRRAFEPETHLLASSKDKKSDRSTHWL